MTGTPVIPRFALALHSVQLPDQVGEWFHLLPAGTFLGADGRGPYHLVPDKVLAAFSARHADACVDYNHQSLEAMRKSGPVPAAGWIKALESRADGIWGRIEWTASAHAALDAKEYRYLSPVFTFSKQTGEVQRLDGAGLTHDPNLHLQAAAGRQGDIMDELLERLRYMLNLPVTTTAEEIMAQLDKLKTMIADQAATQTAAEAMSRTLGLPVATPLADLSSALQTRLAQAPDPAQWVPIAEFQAVNSRLATLSTTTQAEAADRLVTAAMTAGKVAPSMKDWALAYASRDPKGFGDYVAAAPALAPGGIVPSVPPPAAPATLDTDQTAMCRMFGHDPAVIAAAMKEE